MVTEQELELAIAEASALLGLGEYAQYRAAAIDIEPVKAYARRFAQVMEASGRSRDDAIASGFLLAFRLGVLAARSEPVAQ